MTDLFELTIYMSTISFIIWGLWQSVKLWYQRSVAEMELFQNQAGPLVLAMLVVYSLYPYTMFTWLSFSPALIVLPQVYTGVIAAQISHLDYEAIRKVGDALSSLSQYVVHKFTGRG